jgi:hypothetical protein
MAVPLMSKNIIGGIELIITRKENRLIKK